MFSRCAIHTSSDDRIQYVIPQWVPNSLLLDNTRNPIEHCQLEIDSDKILSSSKE